MDTGLAVRPTTGATQTSIARPDPATVRQAVATDLAPAQSVTASSNAEAARHDAQSAQDSNVRKIIIDAHSRDPPRRPPPPPAAAPPRHDAQSAQDSNVRKIIIDAHSREVIFQVVNAESGRVVRQVPEEAMLRLRAYTRAIAQGQTPNEAAPE